MDARLFAGCLGIVAAYVCASTGVSEVFAAIERGRRRRVLGAGDGWLVRRLRNGVRLFLPAADALLKRRAVVRLADIALGMLSEKGIAASKRGVMSVFAAGLVLVGVALGLVSQSPVIGIVGCVAGAVVCIMALSTYEERQRAKAYESLPDALSSMAACLNAGFTLLQTFNQVSKDVKGPLSEPFTQAARTLELGGSAGDALAEIKQGSYSRELAFMAVALDVQHQSGGSMKQVFAAVSDTVRGELALKRSLRVQTAQAKLSARVVSAMPLVLVVLFSIVSPGYLDPFFQSALGIALLGLAVTMQIVGILLVRKALSVGVAA